MWGLDSLGAEYHELAAQAAPIPMPQRRVLHMRVSTMVSRLLRAGVPEADLTLAACFPAPLPEKSMSAYQYVGGGCAGIPNEFMGKGINGSGTREAVARVSEF